MTEGLAEIRTGRVSRCQSAVIAALAIMANQKKGPDFSGPFQNST